MKLTIPFGDVLRRWAGRLQRHRSEKQLRLRETLQLGERRFLAVVEFEQFRFLIAGTANSVALLSQLSAPLSDSPSPLAIQFRAGGKL